MQGEKMRPDGRLVTSTGNTGARMTFTFVSLGAELTRPFYCPRWMQPSRKVDNLELASSPPLKQTLKGLTAEVS